MRYWILTVALLFLAALLAVSACSSRGQLPTNQGDELQTFSDAQSAATRALDTFRKLVTRDNFKELGFESLDEASAAALGEPRRVFDVRLDQLREYREGTDADRLLNDANRIVYPVVVREQVRSSISVEKKDGKWRAVDFGNTGLAKQISATTRAMAANQRPEDTPVLVHVLPFNLYFLGHHLESRLLLTPLADYSTFNLKAGTTTPANDVMAALAVFARSYNGLPM